MSAANDESYGAEREFVRQLLEVAPPRDQLPYTAEFEHLKTQFLERFKADISDNAFWLLLAKEGKKGGLSKGNGRVKDLLRVALTPDEELEVLRLFPDGIGGRDRLPYTKKFDDLYQRFIWLTQRPLSKHEFWRAMTNVAKKSKKPQPMSGELQLGALPAELVHRLQEQNPWWHAGARKRTAPFRRWAYRQMVRRLDSGIASIIAVRGTRQVGKSELQLQFIDELLLYRHVPPTHILRVQFDEVPSIERFESLILEIVRWFEEFVLGESINAAAAREQPVYLLFDELQNLIGWENQLKSLVDHRTVKVLATGSSALRIAQGQDSLAGRINLIHLGTLRLREIAMIRFHEALPVVVGENDIEKWATPEFWRSVVVFAGSHREALKKSFKAYSEFGGYPICHRLSADAEIERGELRRQIQNMVVERTIQHDITAGGGGKRRSEETVTAVFRQLCRYAGQPVTTKTLATEFSKLGIEGITHAAIEDAISFLKDSLLVVAVPPFEGLGKRAAHPSKYCLADHFVREAWLQEQLPLDAETLATTPEAIVSQVGHLAESVVGAYLSQVSGLDLSWLPTASEESEIDFVLTIGLRRIPLEVKYRKQVTNSDCIAIRQFLQQPQFNAPFGVVITQDRVDEEDGVFFVPMYALLGLK